MIDPSDLTALQGAIEAIFERWDVDQSGRLSLEEFRNGLYREASSPQFRNDPSVRLISSAVAREAEERSPTQTSPTSLAGISPEAGAK